MNHKYSTWTLVFIFLLLALTPVLAELTSSDIDDVCSDDHSILYNTPENGWICANLSDTFNVTVNERVEIWNNYSAYANQSLYLGDFDVKNLALWRNESNLAIWDEDISARHIYANNLSTDFIYANETEENYIDLFATNDGSMVFTVSDIGLLKLTTDYISYNEDLRPELDGIYDLGIENQRWNVIYANMLNVTNISSPGGGSISLNGLNIEVDTENDTFAFNSSLVLNKDLITENDVFAGKLWTDTLFVNNISILFGRTQFIPESKTYNIYNIDVTEDGVNRAFVNHTLQNLFGITDFIWGSIDISGVRTTPNYMWLGEDRDLMNLSDKGLIVANNISAGNISASGVICDSNGCIGEVGNNLTVENSFTAGKYRSSGTGLDFNFYDDGSNLVLNASNVAGNNYFGVETDGAFTQLYSNPNPANGYLLYTITETQGADTFINFYEGGTAHNRFWDSGSARIGGPEGYLCSELTNEVDCDTPNTGADLVVEDDVWLGGKLWVNETALIRGNSSFDETVSIQGSGSNYPLVIDPAGSNAIKFEGSATIYGTGSTAYRSDQGFRFWTGNNWANLTFGLWGGTIESSNKSLEINPTFISTYDTAWFGFNTSPQLPTAVVDINGNVSVKELNVDGRLKSTNGCGIPSATFVAEENAVLNDATYEWAFGNGANPTYGNVQACSGRVTAMSIGVLTAPSSGTMKVSIHANGTAVCSINVSSGSSHKFNTECNGAFNAGDKLLGYTDTSGIASNGIITWWVRYD